MARSKDWLRFAWFAACTIGAVGFLTMPVTQRDGVLLFLCALLVAPLFLSGAIVGLVGCVTLRSPGWKSYISGWLVVLTALVVGIQLDQPYRKWQFGSSYIRYRDFVIAVRAKEPRDQMVKRYFTESEKLAAGAYDGSVSWKGSLLVVEFRTPLGMTVESAYYMSERMPLEGSGPLELVKLDELGYWFIEHRR